jgi:RNA polymerase sigma factor (sigma-70 family)
VELENLYLSDLPYMRRLIKHLMRTYGITWDREDCEQEMLLHVWRCMATFDPEKASLRGWLKMVIGMKLCTYIIDTRGRKKSLTTTWARKFSEPFDDDRTLGDMFGELDQNLDRAETMLDVDNALSIMSDTERNSLLMTADGWSWDEITAKHGYPRKMIDNAVQRARAKLRGAMALRETAGELITLDTLAVQLGRTTDALKYLRMRGVFETIRGGVDTFVDIENVEKVTKHIQEHGKKPIKKGVMA